MNAKLDTRKSWEKAQYWKLDNGWTAVQVYSLHYGSFINQLHRGGKLVWQACNGLGALPEFALPWIEIISNQHGPIASLVRPRFTPYCYDKPSRAV